MESTTEDLRALLIKALGESIQDSDEGIIIQISLVIVFDTSLIRSLFPLQRADPITESRLHQFRSKLPPSGHRRP